MKNFTKFCALNRHVTSEAKARLLKGFQQLVRGPACNWGPRDGGGPLDRVSCAVAFLSKGGEKKRQKRQSQVPPSSSTMVGRSTAIHASYHGCLLVHKTTRTHRSCAMRVRFNVFTAAVKDVLLLLQWLVVAAVRLYHCPIYSSRVEELQCSSCSTSKRQSCSTFFFISLLIHKY